MRPNQEYINLLRNVNAIQIIIQNASFGYTSENQSYWTDVRGNLSIANPTGTTCASITYGTKNNLTTYKPAAGAGCNFNLSANLPSADYMANVYTAFHVYRFRTGVNRFNIQRPNAADKLLLFGQIQASRANFIWRDSSINVTYNTKIIRESNSAEFSPTTGNWYLSVLRVDAARNTYFTTNGRGDSGGKNHVSGTTTTTTSTNAMWNNSGSGILTQVLSPGKDLELGELVIWSEALTQTEIDNVEDYMKSKWGISY